MMPSSRESKSSRGLSPLCILTLYHFQESAHNRVRYLRHDAGARAARARARGSSEHPFVANHSESKIGLDALRRGVEGAVACARSDP